METARRIPGAFRIDGLAALGKLRAGDAVARRDFNCVTVALPHLPPAERRIWERDLNEPLRSRGESWGLIGSLVGTVLYVALAAFTTGGLGGRWGLLLVGVAMIAFGGGIGKLLGTAYAQYVFTRRTRLLERRLRARPGLSA